jgi:hypothetical protein
VREAGERQRSVDRVVAVRARHAVEPGEHLEHLADAEIDVEVALLRADADPGTREL